MADLDNGSVSRRARTSNALNYGHLGTATYEREGRKWSFLRRCVGPGLARSGFPFRIVKQETVFGSSTNEDQLPSRPNLSRSSISGHGPYPWSSQSGLASTNVHEEEPLSNAITASLSKYDPLLADRLAFGSASCLLDNDVRSGYATVPVAALALGANGECLVLTQIGQDSVNVSDESNEDLVVKIPTITSNDYTSWTGNGESIVQICFAATSGYQSTWMAARLLSSTIIFHPLFHRRPIPPVLHSSSSSLVPQISHLDPNPILTIPVSRTGGHQHADISFHPADCHVLALIDHHGNWSTWHIDGKRSGTARTLFRIQLLRTGKLYTWDNLIRPAQADPYHDGWHKICWVADDGGYFDRLLLANRRDAVVWHPLDEEKCCINLSLGPTQEAQRILDVQKSALHPGWIFVLTSTRIFCLSTAKNEWREMPVAESYDILCSWPHFRGRWDITLSLTILERAHCVVILVTSCVNAVANVYRIDTPLEHSSTPLSWLEPSFLDMSEISAPLNRQNAGESALTLLMRPLQIQGPSKASGEVLPLSLNKLFVLQADRSVGEILLQDLSKILGVTERDIPNTVLLPPESYLRGVSSKYAELDELDDFIVRGSEDTLHAYPGLAKRRHAQDHGEGARPMPRTGWRVDMQEVCALVNQRSTNELSQDRIHVDDYLQGIRSNLEGPVSNDGGMRLLSDLSSPLLVVTDVEAISDTIVSLARGSSFDGQALPVLYSSLQRLGSNSAVEWYQSLLSDWVTSLPPEVPDRVRVNKERLARTVAADLALAAIATRPLIREPQEQAVPERTYPDSAPLPAEASTSSPLSTLVDRTVYSRPISALSTTEEHPACVRLRNYTTVSSNAMTAATPARIFDILVHLPSSAEDDPSAYDWRSTEATITAERNEAAGKVDPKVRRKAEKLAQAKRNRMQLQMEAAEELLRQQAPPAIGSSQRVLPTREVQSSQVIAPEGTEPAQVGLMSQPERGPFGRRSGGPATGRKDKGKRKEAGFR